MTKNDKFDELKRYDNKVKNSNLFNYLEAQDQLGSEQIDLVNKHIYQNYEKQITEFINCNDYVLELGAGIGLHSFELIKNCKNLVSTESVKILR
tara:strand:+ start:102 stop:383 length:282 start_codon:yes stop_codon:yes gene_type:complete